MAQIKLSGKHAVGQYEFATVDDADLGLVNGRSWKCSAPINGWKCYAQRNYSVDGKSKTEYMHRTITEADPGMDVDHINHDGLDNRRVNLRVVTRSQNILNRKPVGMTGTCAKCGSVFTLAAVPNGAQAHIKYCSDACKKVKPKPSERAATKAWRKSQGLAP